MPINDSSQIEESKLEREELWDEKSKKTENQTREKPIVLRVVEIRDAVEIALLVILETLMLVVPMIGVWWILKLSLLTM
jgi:hypothetical protein